MPVQDTSLEAYRHLRESGELGKKQRIVLAALVRGPMTGKEVEKYLHWPSNSVTSRLRELRKAGYIIWQGDVLNRETGKRAKLNHITWKGRRALGVMK